MPTSKLEILQQMPIFGGISDEALQFLLVRSSAVKLDAGEFFFHEGDSAESLYVLERGKVSITKCWEEQNCIIRYLAQGDCFGEMALIDMGPRSATVRAEEDCCAIELSLNALYELYQQDPTQFAMIQMNMARELSRRLREVNERLFQMQLDAQPPKG
ncbi:Crp/Fnr family transcriptional regulator [Marinobacterium arenosum]|uniref:Crp/Fnr family transcriptional regulator n=1 Tax=Marinobacterium arenosum TaxID=2862496 RepID=UPI001C95E622|nr:Crp/Fnr family transcriptional regulator [Marinobacterium arenosum]MBY4676247.1 Crp/Fnr family transcriptional regulator [Marinobacterium arenosum]